MLLVVILFFAPLNAISQDKGASEEVEVLFVQDAEAYELVGGAIVL